MKSDRPNPLARLSLTLSSFFFVVFLYIWFSINEVQFDALRRLGQSTISNFQYNQTVEKSLVQNATSSPPDLRILLGILTLPDQYERRHFLRLIYGTQSTVGAQVDVKFVFCNLTKEDQQVLVALEIMQYNDIIILNCKENMNTGKTYTYFSSLPEIFDDPEGPNPPYHYVMKADDDTYFRLNNLVESLKPLAREDLYYGYVIPCPSMDPFKHYMSGMGYLISWDIVEWIRKSEIPRNHTDGPEDRVFGSWIREGHRAKNRYNAKWSMYDYPIPPTVCTHELWPDTIAVHKLKNKEKWVKTLQYFNVTNELPLSKLYHIP
ncbi:Galactosyltransferase family protein [Thalictrum thalictroides]|uniref:Hexosyltransferase n=1 Tax=Thalictrum thalictroides TaxID=46969 RepID=A0A7J6WUM3_THATH|nr:Galactosyltransferase family protein [Thalictrum thalictroides]